MTAGDAEPRLDLVVTHRRYVPHGAAHYGGGLVDGAYVLGLLGDVATEACIRMDGDEGLFAAYSEVQFRAPVRAGDVIEVSAAVTAVGRRSRELAFEARVVCRADPSRGPSAATVLAEPLIAVTATGTVVVPAPLQGRARADAAAGGRAGGHTAAAQQAGSHQQAGGPGEQHRDGQEDKRVDEHGAGDVLGVQPAAELPGEFVTGAPGEPEPGADDHDPQRGVGGPGAAVGTAVGPGRDPHERARHQAQHDPGADGRQLQPQPGPGTAGALEIDGRDHSGDDDRPQQPSRRDPPVAQVRLEDRGEHDEVEYPHAG
ncbi:MAG: hypothetical protein JOY82_07370 [Streptosporangiaceae bacterium]|nr:hypothetical protein [Streptosporangiaceae bacterium]MBV9854335.1 hypothetical protein [Streptosporangiaceae bacterium]